MVNNKQNCGCANYYIFERVYSLSNIDPQKVTNEEGTFKIKSNVLVFYKDILRLQYHKLVLER